MKSNRIFFLFPFLLGVICTITLFQVISCAGPAGKAPAPRGAWVSSGGELFKDANNPWFVKNTTTVHYCVNIDESSFSATREEAEVLVRKAIQYWKKEFAIFGKYANTVDLRIA